MLFFSNRCVELIKRFEGYRNRPYLDSRNIPTIGYGTTIYPDGKRVTMQDSPINQTLALQMLLSHLNREVLPHLKKLLTVPQTQNQIDALGCLIYNIGIGQFKKSTVLKYINAKKSIKFIEEAWMRYNMSGGRVLNGLIARRKEEFKLYASSETRFNAVGDVQ